MCRAEHSCHCVTTTGIGMRYAEFAIGVTRVSIPLEWRRRGLEGEIEHCVGAFGRMCGIRIATNGRFGYRPLRSLSTPLQRAARAGERSARP